MGPVAEGPGSGAGRSSPLAEAGEVAAARDGHDGRGEAEKAQQRDGASGHEGTSDSSSAHRSCSCWEWSGRAACLSGDRSQATVARTGSSDNDHSVPNGPRAGSTIGVHRGQLGLANAV
jgi:hypothetical protein